jgi:hypothetical protein
VPLAALDNGIHLRCNVSGSLSKLLDCISTPKHAAASSRGWRLDKLKQQHKIDVVVALSMACLAAVRGQSEPAYDLWSCFPDEETDAAARNQQYRNEFAARIYAISGGQCWPR